MTATYTTAASVVHAYFKQCERKPRRVKGKWSAIVQGDFARYVDFLANAGLATMDAMEDAIREFAADNSKQPNR